MGKPKIRPSRGKPPVKIIPIAEFGPFVQKHLNDKAFVRKAMARLYKREPGLIELFKGIQNQVEFGSRRQLIAVEDELVKSAVMLELQRQGSYQFGFGGFEIQIATKKGKATLRVQKTQNGWKMRISEE